MDVRYTRASLRSLDLLSTEVLVGCITTDERPSRGLCGLVDFRLAGKISRAQKSGFLTGELDEMGMLPGRPKLSFDKVLLVGLGASTDFNEQVYRRALRSILKTLEGLRVRSAVVELPGRTAELVAPARALEILFELTHGSPAHDTWTLVESAEGQRAMSDLVVQERRRVRPLSAES
jgi:hypothetical protein